MTTIRPKVQEEEPVGIVISRGTREEAIPKFWAYVWAPAPKEMGEMGTAGVRAA